ncbi:hypothetical protein [Shewanella sp.]|uniref:hypothetical protein n=1 Tax=Shewanella sp. TaxID=50422 RepID=UPI0040538A71
MSGLDSLYAMLARPVTANVKLKRKVVQPHQGKDITEDSHESPQSQLPPRIIRPRSERRNASNNRYIKAYDRRQKQTKLASDPAPNIDINI